jgi:DNA repair protein RadA/Sms
LPSRQRIAAAAALISSHTAALAQRLRVLGEIALSGDVRPAPHAEARLKEAAKLGFKRAFVPAGTKAHGVALALEGIEDVSDLVRLVGDSRR